VAIGGAQDQELGAGVVQRAGARGANAAGALTLRESAAVVERAAVLVTNDSAPLHLASAVGTPIVAIFGPTVPAFGFGPIRPGDRVVEHPDLACRPCSQHGPRVCPLGHHRCMKEVTVDQVLSALTEVQNAGEARRAVHRRN
jgi:heptosyltransferase-2